MFLALFPKDGSRLLLILLILFGFLVIPLRVFYRTFCLFAVPCVCLVLAQLFCCLDPYYLQLHTTLFFFGGGIVQILNILRCYTCLGHQSVTLCLHSLVAYTSLVYFSLGSRLTHPNYFQTNSL